MPTFFTKVFSRGKDKDGLKEPPQPTTKQSKRSSRASIQSLLEGKFEAVSPTVSPSAQKFDEKEKALGKDKDKGKEKDKEKEKEKIALFRPKSRTTGTGAVRKTEDVPQLTLDLNLSSVKSDPKRRDLDVVYEGITLLDDAALGEKRLSSGEALKLMRACMSVIASRGLETLGVMHPHWHSASPAAQRKIISLYLSSLDATPATASTSSPTSAASAFEYELEYARSPHDVAAVFRWALRHLKLDGDAFGKDDTPTLAWYDGFSEQEKTKSYPQTAFSELLLPVVKPPHAELLNSTLSLISNLASHSEMNGVSGSKLSMFLGQYLLTGNKVDGLEDWLTFYSHWERAGRALEHIFLASLRDEASKTGIPKRLSELVVNYPYSKHATDSQFPRPARFATRAYDALYVRVTSELGAGVKASEELHHPLRIIENALKADVNDGADGADATALWEEVKKLSSKVEDVAVDKSLSNVLSDETIRLLSLKSDGTDKGTPTITMFTVVPERGDLFSKQNGSAANGSAKSANGSASVSRRTSEGTKGEASPIVTDWNMFSSAGFGESSAGQSLAATLMDTDLEKTEPSSLVPRRSLRKSRSPGRGDRTARLSLPATPIARPRHYKTALVSLVKLDESFIDFWSDALLDSVTFTWPAFVVCQLRSDVAPLHDDKRVTWLIVEQKFVTPPPPIPSEPSSPVRRASSPRPSARSESKERSGVIGRVSSTFSPRKRLNLFGGQTTTSAVPATVSGAEKKEGKVTKEAKIGEMGEIIPEENIAPPPQETKAVAPETVKEEPTKEADAEPSTVAGDVAAVGGAGVVAAIAAAAENAVSAAPGAELPVAEEESISEVKEAKEERKEGLADVPANEADISTPSAPPTLEDQGELANKIDRPAVVEVETTEPSTVSGPLDGESAPIDVDPTSVPVVSTGAEEAAVIAPEGRVKEVVAEVPEATAAATTEPPVLIDTEVENVEAPLSEAVPQVAQTEGAAAGVHPGAGKSRFVEHIETPPDDDITTEPAEEPLVESSAELLPSVVEEPDSAEAEVAPTDKPLDAATELPALQADEVAATEESTDIAVSEEPEAESEPQPIESSSAPVIDEPTTTVIEEPVVADATESTTLVAEGSEALIVEEASSPQITTTVIERSEALVNEEVDSAADETTAPAPAELPVSDVEQAAVPVAEETVIPEESGDAVEEIPEPAELPASDDAAPSVEVTPTEVVPPVEEQPEAEHVPLESAAIAESATETSEPSDSTPAVAEETIEEDPEAAVAGEIDGSETIAEGAEVLPESIPVEASPPHVDESPARPETPEPSEGKDEDQSTST
ncbi:hypothetical protein M0805_009391 [Coniferiporia weirii]|nr:hypothetical protein M0805_009391 [Coniferiporia weirii]